MKISFLRIISFLFFLCGSIMVSDNFAATLTVTKTIDTADGVCDADCSLREAIFAAAGGDTVVFSPLFNTPQTITLTSGQIAITKNLTVAGAGTDLVMISGNNVGRIFYISSNSVVALSGMKLTGGSVTTGNDVFGGAIYLINSTLTLTNVTLSDNKARFMNQQSSLTPGRGGAIYVYNGRLAVINSTINNNDSPEGAGIYSEDGIINVSGSKINNNTGTGVSGSSLSTAGAQINIFNSTLSGNSNTAVTGGSDRISISNSVITNNAAGISNGDSYAILTIDRSIISNNESLTFAGSGGGGVGNSGTATISNTLISNNRVSGNGGGIYNTGTLNLINSAIINNRALLAAGGIFHTFGQLFVTNSTISGNSADYGGNFGSSPGGGIYNLSNEVNRGGSIIITNSTITNNLAIGKGGGLRVDTGGAVTIRNTIIAGNKSLTNETDVSGTIVSQGFNLIGNTTGSSGWINADLLNRNPLLAPLGNNGGLTLTHALMPGSPAIDAGISSLAKDPTTGLPLFLDQRGSVRVFAPGGFDRVDIGAYESNIANSPVTLSGRILTNTGRGINKAIITLTDSNGTVIYAQTNAFGYYRFVNLLPATTYTITVVYKGYGFNSPQTVTIDNDRDNLNFIAQ
jgi:CSLREA domain-containing protein